MSLYLENGEQYSSSGFPRSLAKDHTSTSGVDSDFPLSNPPITETLDTDRTRTIASRFSWSPPSAAEHFSLDSQIAIEDARPPNPAELDAIRPAEELPVEEPRYYGSQLVAMRVHQQVERVRAPLEQQVRQLQVENEDLMASNGAMGTNSAASVELEEPTSYGSSRSFFDLHQIQSRGVSLWSAWAETTSENLLRPAEETQQPQNYEALQFRNLLD